MEKQQQQQRESGALPVTQSVSQSVSNLLGEEEKKNSLQNSQMAQTRQLTLHRIICMRNELACSEPSIAAERVLHFPPLTSEGGAAGDQAGTRLEAGSAAPITSD